MHVACHAINENLGNVGKTVFYTDPVDANPINQTESIKELVADMQAGKVDLLIILGGNPAYDAPADLNFADALKSGKIPLRIHYGLYQNETAELCQWHVNATHELEAWGDARAYDGTVSIIQPLIAPLYNGKSAHRNSSRCSPDKPMPPATIWCAPIGKSSTQAPTSSSSGASRCTTDGSKVQPTQPKTLAAKIRKAMLGSIRGRPNTIELNIRRDPTSTTDNSPTTAGSRNSPSR